ncbi:hypothetical protein BDZ88DRAFT_83772 [Geranomyces variabilis]|nr:hypothetical protein BDZ88DRAFT_83772 [Geranomyces variabilis]
MKGSASTKTEGKEFPLWFGPQTCAPIFLTPFCADAGLRRRGDIGDDSPESGLVMTTSGSSNTVFVSARPALHVDSPPEGLSAGPVFAPAPLYYQPLKTVMPVVRSSIKCFDHSIVDSKIDMSTGERTKCFSAARRALRSLTPADSHIAAAHLLSPREMNSAIWVGFDLVGEMCDAVPSLLETLLEKMLERFDQDGPSLALQAAFKCTQPTPAAVATLTSLVERHTMPGENQTIEFTIVNQAALLLGHFGYHLRKGGDLQEAASVTAILNRALRHPSSKLSRRSTVELDFGEAPDDEHILETSLRDSEDAARRATLLLALGHTQDASIVSTLRSAIFEEEADISYHPVVQQAALSALGRLFGRDVEDTLLATLTSEQHIPVHAAALRALRARDRDLDIEQIALGAEELQQIYQGGVTRAGPLSARSSRVDDIVNLNLDLTLAAPSFNWDEKYGADIVGVRLKALAVNQVRLFLSILRSDFYLEINNAASAMLYIDIGSYQEIEIFVAELKLIGEIQYNMDVLHGFKLSDVTKFKEIFNGWIVTVKQEFELVQKKLSVYWNLAGEAFETLRVIIDEVAGTDWTTFFDDILKVADEEIGVVLDIFKETEANIVSFGKSVKDLVITTVMSAKDMMDDAIRDILGGIANIIDCPEQSVAATLSAVEEVQGIAMILHSAFDQLQTMLSIDNLQNLLPDIDEEFGDYINNTLSAYPTLQPVVDVYRNFTIITDTLADTMDYVMGNYTNFRVVLQEQVASYNKVKAFYDATFGPKADSNFPNEPVTTFPAEVWTDTDGVNYQGMGVKTVAGAKIVAPFAGTFKKIDDTTAKIVVTEASLKSYQIILRNFATTTRNDTVRKGGEIGTATAASVQIFIYGGRYSQTSVDPRKYLSRALPIKKPFEVTANTYGLTVMGQAIVPFQAIIKRNTDKASAATDIEGKGLEARDNRSPADVCADPRFANPPQVCVNANIPESPKAIQLEKFEEFFMVAGIIPVTFTLEFDALMGISAAVSLCLTELTVTPTLTPHFAILMIGFAGLGVPGASVGLTARGTVADTHVPITPKFPITNIPGGVCLSIDVVIVPLSIELSITITLIFFSYSAQIAQFSMAPVTLHIFNSCPADGIAHTNQPGFFVDSTAPVVTSSGAYQVANEKLTSPFIIARFASNDPESGMDSVSVGIGWSPADMAVVPPRILPRDQGDSWSIPMAVDPLLDEKTLYVNVIHKNLQNLITTTSTPVFFDLSPPVISIWNEQTPIEDYIYDVGRQNPRAILRKNLAPFSEELSASVNGSSFTGIPNRICFYYSILDGSAQNQTSWAIGTGQQVASASNVVPWTLDPLAGQGVTSVCQSIPLSHGQLYYLNLETINSVGYAVSQSSTPTMVDLTPPIPGSIYFGPTLGQTMNGTIVNSTAFFNFIDYKDPESGVAYWNFAIGPSTLETTEIESNVTAWEPFNAWTHYILNEAFASHVPLFISNVNMTEGNHTMCVSSTNFVGLSSIHCTKGYVVDQTPPTGEVTLVAGTNLDLTVEFTYADVNGSSVRTVMVGLGDMLSPHYADYVILDVGELPQTNYTFPIDLSMQGHSVYGLLIVIDYATNSRHVASEWPLLIDMLPPIAGTVGDSAILDEDLSWISSLDNLCASWTPWSSNVSSVGSYDLCFGTSPGICDMHNMTSVGLVRSQCFALPLAARPLVYEGMTVFATVMGHNGLNTTNSTASSDGVSLDTTPPENFNASIITPTGASFIRDISEVDVQWTPSYDGQSGLSRYMIQLQRQRGNQTTALKDYLVADLSDPLKSSAVIRGKTSDAEDGDSILVCVNAYNIAELQTRSCSPSVTVDSRRPALVYRSYLNNTALSTPFYVKNLSSVDLLWKWTAASGIQNYYCNLYSYSTGSVVPVGMIQDKQGCHFSANSQQLLDGNMYQVLGSVISNVGMS